MIFDKLCKSVETHKDLSFLIPILRKTKLFDFRNVSFKQTDDKDKEYDEACQNFVLPFKHTAIETRNICMIILDLDEKAFGLMEERKCICVMTKDKKATEIELYPGVGYIKTIEEIFQEKRNETFPDDILFIVKGFIENIDIVKFKTVEKDEIKDFVDSSVSASRLWLTDKKKMWFESSKDGKNSITEQTKYCILESAILAIHCLISINHPKLFVLEEKNINKNHKRQISRSHERPIYTILEPNKIRKKLGLEHPKGTHNSPIPHERRRHGRWYRSIKYATRQDGTSRALKYDHRGLPYYMYRDIPSSWIGNSEKQIGNKLYKVRLDI